MKIAFYTDNFFPEISGITDSLITLATELGQRGHQLYFFAPKYGTKDFRKAALKPEEIKINQNVTIARFFSLPYPNSPTGQGRIVLPLPCRFRSLQHYGIDIIHSQSPFGCGREALLAAKFLKIPLLGTNHTPIAEFIPAVFSWTPTVTLIMEKYYTWYYNRTDYVTAPSQGILQEMVQSGLKRPYQAISNPVDTSGYLPITSEQKQILRAKLGLTVPTILYAGRLAEEKHIDVILRAVAIIKQKNGALKLIITGLGPARPKLEKLIKTLNLENDVIFTGFIEKSKLIELYQAADIFTIMSTAETQCLSLMNAFAAGLPAVVAAARALPEFIGKDRGLLVEPGDANALANSIITLLKDTGLCQRITSQAQVFVQTLSTKNIADHWEKIYTEIITKKTHARK